MRFHSTWKMVRSRSAAIKAFSTTIKRFWLSVFDQRQFALETDGREFALQSRCASEQSKNTQHTTVLPLDVQSLQRALRSNDYHGSPIAIVLHPPCVCLKVLRCSQEHPDKWLASHLAEVAPPGNRRDLAMCHRIASDGQLELVFVQKSFLSLLRESLQACGVSVRCVVAGGSIILDEGVWSTAAGKQQEFSFRLCSYSMRYSENGVVIVPDPVRHRLETDTSRTPDDSAFLRAPVSVAMCGVSASMFTGGKELDFARQMGVGKPLPTKALRRSLRIATVMLIGLLVILVLDFGAHLLITMPSTDAELQSVVAEWEQLRTRNRQLSDRVASLQGSRRHVHAAAFLKSVAIIMPPETWLASLTYGPVQPAQPIPFAMVGYSKDLDEPVQLADSLHTVRRIVSATLARTNRVDSPIRSSTPSAIAAQVSRFELVGTYAADY